MYIQVSLIVDSDATADLATMEQEVLAAGQQGMRQALSEAVRCWERSHRGCPSCGSHDVRLEGTVPRNVHALFGKVRLNRQRLRCQRCLRRLCPADELLAPLARGRISPRLVEVACLAGASWSYRCAVQVLTHLSGA